MDGIFAKKGNSALPAGKISHMASEITDAQLAIQNLARKMSAPTKLALKNTWQ